MFDVIVRNKSDYTMFALLESLEEEMGKQGVSSLPNLVLKFIFPYVEEVMVELKEDDDLKLMYLLFKDRSGDIHLYIGNALVPNTLVFKYQEQRKLKENKRLRKLIEMQLENEREKERIRRERERHASEKRLDYELLRSHVEKFGFWDLVTCLKLLSRAFVLWRFQRLFLIVMILMLLMVVELTFLKQTQIFTMSHPILPLQ